MDHVRDRLVGILAQSLRIDPKQATDDAELMKDLEADSLDVVGVVLEIEDAFDIKISDDEADAIVTVGDALRLIERLRVPA